MSEARATESASLEAVAEARRALAAGLALWREGLVAESHVHMVEALRAALRAWDPVDAASPADGAAPTAAVLPDSGGKSAAGTSSTADPPPSWEPALSALDAAGYRHPDRLRTALATPSSSGAPARPELDWIWDEIDRLCRFSLRRLTPQRARRRRRIYGGAVCAVLAIAVAVTLAQLWGGPLASASGTFSAEHPASLAVDGMVATEWLLPDRTAGWLQISFRSRRTVRSVRIYNAHNRYYMDRASERVRVTAFSDQGPVATAEGRFAAMSIERSALDLPLAADHVTHLRVEVLSYFRNGGGLAEVEVH